MLLDKKFGSLVYFSLTSMPFDPAMMTTVAMSRNRPWSTTPSKARMASEAACASLIGSCSRSS